MVQREDAEQLAARWLAAWNAHDVDAVMADFHPDVVTVTPMAIALGVSQSGKVRGADAVRAYYEHGLARLPDLHFELEAVLVGVDTVTILYRNQRGQQVAETMVLDGDQVVRVMVSYGPDGPTASS